MWIVTPRTAGPQAYARMLRDGVLRPVVPGIAVAHDIHVTPAVRAHALLSILPPDVQVTALAALWVHGHVPWPDTVDLRTDGSARVRAHELEVDVVVHAVGFDGAPGVAPAHRAAADALRWSPRAWAVPAALGAFDAGQISLGELDTWEALARRSLSTRGSADACALVRAAIDGRASARTGPTQRSMGRLVPVTRRAS